MVKKPWIGRRSRIALCMVIPVLFLYVNNTSWVSDGPNQTPTVLAHRALSQRYDQADRAAGSCDAARMLPPRHDYVENTLPSIEAAFMHGADVVEFDVQPTRDGRFVVFHDRTLDCRTNGNGLTREHTLEELQALDVGYGYTADGGRTYPFRGHGIGMPSIDEVFEALPRASFLIDIKGNGSDDGRSLGDHLARLSPEHRSRLMVFGSEETLQGLRSVLPDMKSFSVASIRDCLIRYIGYGWTGLVPEACMDSPLFVPINVAPFLWGWPNRFIDRMHVTGSPIVIIGAFGQGGIAPGVDTLEEFRRVPPNFDGGIWTNEVALIDGQIEGRSAGRRR